MDRPSRHTNPRKGHMSGPEKGLQSHLTPGQSASQSGVMTAAHHTDTTSARSVGTSPSMTIPVSPKAPPQNANPLAANTADEASLPFPIQRRIAELESDQIRSVVAIRGNQRAKKRPGRGGICQCERCRRAKRGSKVSFPIRQLYTDLLI